MKYTVIYIARKGDNLSKQALNAIAVQKGYEFIFVNNSECEFSYEKEIITKNYEKYSFLSFKNKSDGQIINLCAKKAKGDWLLLLKEGAEIQTDCTEKYLNKYPNAVVFELRQYPVETENHFDPVDLNCFTASFDCTYVKREAFLACGGFDNVFKVYKNVDLSFRIREKGDIIYCPETQVLTKQTPEDIYIYTQSQIEKLLLGYKYCQDKTLQNEFKNEFKNTLKNPRHYPNVRKVLLKLYILHYIYKMAVSKKGVVPKEKADFENAFNLKRGVYPLCELKENPLVSILVRTHRRKEVLRRTLKCLENQIYKNFEVVIVEDGENTAEEMIKKDFSHLNINYCATGDNVGRGKAGNIAIERAKGEYLCFLDDDDYYYPDYILSNLSFFEKHKEANIAFSSITAAKMQVKSTDPYIFDYKGFYPVIFDHITLMDMCVKCRVPITAAMFKNSLYEKGLGMREDIDGDEDWAMWLKLTAKGKRGDDFAPDIPKALSMCAFPADSAQEAERQNRYAAFDRQMLYDERLIFTVKGSDILKWEEYVKNDIEHLKNIGMLDDFMHNLKPLGIEKLNYNPNGENTITAKQINNYYYYLVKEFAK